MNDFGLPKLPTTIMEVFKTLPERTLAEVIDNRLIVSPSPTVEHQRMSVRLLSQVSEYVKVRRLGEVLFRICDLYFDDTNVVQPDIFFIAAENPVRFLGNEIHGFPDLIIEIVIDESRYRDLYTKKSLYERFGVKEYWIVDPLSKETTGFLLKDGIYRPLENGFGQLHSSILAQTFTF
jgi:Uma2 family endonuclease